MSMVHGVATGPMLCALVIFRYPTPAARKQGLHAVAQPIEPGGIMKIHEYQAKELFKTYNVPVPEGGVAFTSEEAKTVAGRLDGFPVVVKAPTRQAPRGGW